MVILLTSPFLWRQRRISKTAPTAVHDMNGVLGISNPGTQGPIYFMHIGWVYIVIYDNNPFEHISDGIRSSGDHCSHHRMSGKFLLERYHDTTVNGCSLQDPYPFYTGDLLIQLFP